MQLAIVILFFYNNSKNIKSFWSFNSSLPVTIYTFIHYDLNIYHIGNILGFNNLNIKEGDNVIFYYGWNDMQKNIGKYHQDNPNIEIDSLCKQYMEKIIRLSQIYKIKPIIPCIYPNPHPHTIDKSVIFGTHEERRSYSEYANKCLRDLCIFYNVPFFDIYDFLLDDNGYIKIDMTDDGMHLDYLKHSLHLCTFKMPIF